MFDPNPMTRSDVNPTSPWVIWIENACRVTFAAFIVLSAFSIAFSQMALGLAVLTGLALWIVKRPRLSPPAQSVLLAAGLFVVWLVVASLAGDRPWESLGAIREEWLFLIIPLGLLLARDTKTQQRLVLLLSATLFMLGAYGILQHFTGLYLFKEGGLHHAGVEVRISGGFSHPLTFGNYLVSATLFVSAYAAAMFRQWSGWRRWLPLAAAVCGLVTVALCNSRGPMLSAGVGLIALGLVSRKFVYALMAIAVTALVFAVVSPSVISVFTHRMERDFNATQPASRLFIWQTAARIAMSSPLTGVGPANFGRAYGHHLPPDFEGVSDQGHAHNDFLHIAAVAGLPGLIFFTFLWVVVVRQLWRGWRNHYLSPPSRALALAALIGSVTFLATSMTEATFTDEEVRQLLMLIWALGLSAWNVPARAGGQSSSETA